jgi:hypothetical protein
MAEKGMDARSLPGEPQMGVVYDSTVAYAALAKNTTNFQQVDPAGAAVANGEGRIPTYSAATANFAANAAAQDILAIFGSATKTVRLKRIALSGRASAAGQLDVTLVKRSSAASSSTSAALTAVPHDSVIDAAATAQIVTYSSSGTTGAIQAIGMMRAQQANVSQAGSGGAAIPVEWHFGDVNDQSAVLRSTSEFFALSLPGSTAPAGIVLNLFAEWSEE